MQQYEQQQQYNGALSSAWSQALSELAQRMMTPKPTADDLALYSNLSRSQLAAVQSMMLPSQM